MTRPLLLLDVDGPLNPWAARTPPPRHVEHRFRVSRWGRWLTVWLDPHLGPELLALAARTGAELAWATTWGHRANGEIGPALGLPPLPVVEFAGPFAQSRPGWKFPAVARFAYGRPLAWLDDDFGLYPAARDRFLGRRRADGVATMLVAVDPATGVRAAQLAAVERWFADGTPDGRT
jgi:hypothetical protein